MPDEIEAKVRVVDHVAVRERLRAAGATGGEVTQEINTFFDSAAKELLARDEGVRLRLNQRGGGNSHVITYKGPKKPGPYKSREEVEFHVSDPAALRRVFEAMGYRPTLTFRKRRETWHLGPCHVELDTLTDLPGPNLFVEVEGPDEPSIHGVLQQLGLEAHPIVKESYSKMMGGK